MMIRQDPGVFVVDEENSPLWKVAHAHASRSGDRVLAADQFCSVSALIREVLKFPTSYLIFTWRGAFDSVLQSKVARQKLRKGLVSVYLLVPDLVGVHQITEMEQSRINNADGLIVTSEELFYNYKKIYKLKNIQMLHDFPPLDSFNEIAISPIARNSRKIIWVGNSRWGERAGFLDHKGLHSFALPVFQKLQKDFEDLSLTVIDSGVKKLSYEKVLSEIASSACLIFTSDSEGTGLPLLEAAALGTPLVTFSVGIAPELLRGDLEILISPKNLEQFAEKVLFVLKNNQELSRKIVRASDEYMTKILGDFERLKLQGLDSGSWRNQKNHLSWKSFVKWKYRWLRYLRSKVLAK